MKKDFGIVLAIPLQRHIVISFLLLVGSASAAQLTFRSTIELVAAHSVGHPTDSAVHERNQRVTNR
jgi:hypothetical protein